MCGWCIIQIVVLVMYVSFNIVIYGWCVVWLVCVFVGVLHSRCVIHSKCVTSKLCVLLCIGDSVRVSFGGGV